MKNNTTSKPIDVEDILKEIETDPTFKEKLNELGIEMTENGLVAPINYYSLLTAKEKVLLKERINNSFKNPELFANFYIKFSNISGALTFCATDTVCDSCFKSLLKEREKLKNELKHQ